MSHEASRGDERFRGLTDAYAIAQHFKALRAQAIMDAGNAEMRDLLLPEVMAKAVATWNIAVEAIEEHGRPLMITKSGPIYRGQDKHTMEARSTGLLELSGWAGEMPEGTPVPAIRLSAHSTRTHNKRWVEPVQDLAPWQRTDAKNSIRAELYMVRPMTAEDKKDESLSSVRETQLPSAVSRLPRFSLWPMLYAKPSSIEVVTSVLDLTTDDPIQYAGNKLLFRPHTPGDHWDVDTFEKVQEVAEMKAEAWTSHVVMHAIIGAIGEPLRDNPAYQR